MKWQRGEARRAVRGRRPFPTAGTSRPSSIQAKSPGLFLADVVALIASFDGVAPEIDR
ncbi:hypothetical protein [Sorangium sp. So ce117]|uniref:hypothetical protein n=1 Tax=unclassified Sorangium TaxID=2621164 RepID=UPI003F5DA61A